MAKKALKKVPVETKTKTKQNIFDHTSVFVLFSPVHTNPFSYEKRILFDAFSTIVHNETTENADGIFSSPFLNAFNTGNGAFSKRYVF